MDYSYWQKQSSEIPLFPDIEWNKPETRSRAGRLGIIGGNKLGFVGVSEAYGTAMKAGVGHVRTLLPDILRKTIPTSMNEVLFAATNQSGGLAQEAQADMTALGAWADVILFIGDAGRSSETAIVYEQFLIDYTGPLVLTRDAVDLIKNSPRTIIERPQTILVISFAQLQKLFQSVYYPKVLTFNMQLTNLIEAIHKFTITYPVTIAVLHHDTFIIAHDGHVVTTPWDQPMLIWRGVAAANIAAYWVWSVNKPLEATATAILNIRS